VSSGAVSLADRRRRLEALLGVPATEGNQVWVLRNGDEIFPAMLEAIGSARRTVDLLTYVYWTGRPAEQFATALAERARAGLTVRVLIDAVGGFPMDRDLTQTMTDAGVRVEFFRRPWVRSPFTHNHRTHRKVLVVDGETGFTGGVGIAEQWEGDARTPDEWRDTHLRVRGPAVAGLQAAFVQNWAETTGEPEEPGRSYPALVQAGEDVVQVVRGTASVGWDDIETAWYALVSAAQQRVRLQTAYFAPDGYFAELLTAAARRGVDVQVLLPGPHIDKRVSRVASEAYEGDLLEAGVAVWRYQPTMLHTKVLVVDGDVAMVGSSNFNRRSLDHDEEVGVIVLGGQVPRVLERHFAADLSRSLPVRPADVAARPASHRLLEAALLPVRRFL
jgi:cardiolipin synthase